MDAAAWIADQDGVARYVALGSIATDSEPHELDTRVSEGSTLLAIELAAVSLPAGTDLSVAVAARDDSGAVALPIASTALTPARRSVRLGTVSGLPDALPAAISSRLGDQLAAKTGDEITVRIGSGGRSIRLLIVGVSAVLPGIGSKAGVVMDLSALMARSTQVEGTVPAAGELWVQTDDRAAASASIRASTTERVDILTPDAIGVAGLTEPAVSLSLVGVGAAALLAAVCFVQIYVRLVRRRRADRVPLRAFGLTASASRRIGAIEVGSIVLLAVIGGAVSGALASWILLPILLPTLAVVS